MFKNELFLTINLKVLNIINLTCLKIIKPFQYEKNIIMTADADLSSVQIIDIDDIEDKQ